MRAVTLANERKQWWLRRADEGDAAMLALVGAATFLDAFAGVSPGPDIVRHCAREHSAQRYATWLADPASAIWIVAADGGAAVGYAVLTTPDLPLPDIGAHDMEVKRIYLLSRFHGGGAAAAMMDAALAEAARRGKRRLLLGTYRGNDRAIGFYRKTGFAVAGERQFRVGDTVYDDIVMARVMAPA